MKQCTFRTHESDSRHGFSLFFGFSMMRAFCEMKKKIEKTVTHFINLRTYTIIKYQPAIFNGN